MHRTPSKITNPYLKWHISLHEIEAQIIQFTNLPTQTPGLHLLSQDITKKFGFIRNFLIAEAVSHYLLPGDLVEIEKKLVELEAEFYHSNLHRVDVEHERDHEHEHKHEREREREHEHEYEHGHEHKPEPGHEHEDDDSEMGSVCESCLNYDREFEEEAVSDDAWSVHGVFEMLRDYEVKVPQSLEEFRDSTAMLPEKVEEATSYDCKKDKTAKRGRRWWWRTVVILMPASVVIMAVSYFEKKQREGFLIPT